MKIQVYYMYRQDSYKPENEKYGERVIDQLFGQFQFT